MSYNGNGNQHNLKSGAPLLRLKTANCLHIQMISCRTYYIY